MSDEFVAALTTFHREVALPDMQRMLDAAEARINARFDHQLDAIYQRFDRLETEYHMLVAGVRRVEERLDGVEQRLDHVEQRLERVEQRLERVEQKLDRAALKSEVIALKARVEELERRLNEIDAS